MRKLTLLLSVLSVLLFVQQVQAQEPQTETLEEYAVPGVNGMGRSRGIVASYERLPQFDIDSDSEDPRIGDGNGRVKRYNKFDFRAFAPLLNKPQDKVILGFTYNIEEFNFDATTPARYPIYHYLEDKNLRSIGLQLAYLHSIDVHNFYLVRVVGELNGDYTRDDINISDYLKATVDLAYGWKKTPNYAIGVGLQLGYTFGRQNVYPGVLYNRTFNDRWGVESIFPANARVRYNANEKTLLYAGYRLEGASYNLYVDEPPLSEFEDLELRRTDIKALVRLEREIYDFLWFSVEGGFRQYFRNRLFDDVGSRNEIINNDLAGTGYIGVELYLVPPRKWVEKSNN
ncbi:hypothetical protein CLV24_11753 [Pontibacter ummariensis]|uniref:DUF6268 domain-containing protein n=1 Tax=Pontibacter ummariensis TaxID=1610492 RepID=A0A239IH48_9BACT|nr:DUF6268 family outer membrane beta-barrel protein [Pontibacter ummariensis]PRY09848.1 hypothetical protein CLV24_11753 [Pontibacter ummariensis]SNS92927.1 hypothetical protein SAMN06296052_11753 [Pontibacter ummariensis]